MKKLRIFLLLLFGSSLLLLSNPPSSFAVRCATKGSILCALRTNCPEDSHYAGYCCDNLQQCYDTTTTPPQSAPSPVCGVNDLGVRTAFGCLMAGDPKQLISQLLGWGVVVGGGIAFVMILIAGFQITTAAGDPKKVQAARELLTAAIQGLLLIVFSVLILNLIGFSILKLPGFSVPL